MNEYIGSTVAKLKANSFSGLTIVIGNESCDLDTAVSSLVFANFLYWQHNQLKCKVCTKEYRDGSMEYKDELFVPVINVDRNDFPLKTEVAYLFREKGISESALIYRLNKLNRLLAARTDVSHLSAAQLMKKDVKVIGNVLVPSFPILVKVRPGNS
ncbi:hypothetical protein HF086_002490 [Spodoptera exigua]|uniref:Uncharacterized protein n=1 Tax=Spodoptera exigua TaxID=7107 RepID=A0A922SFM2_SPOEX|nr:hypothetical protein HF086_002490 [Spodoptera exigua]